MLWGGRHRDTLVATIRIATDKQVSTQNRTFATYADGIEELSRWLDKHSVEAVMMEATGVYFQPLVHALRRLSPHRLVSVANPSAVKQIPGRKTDVSDSAWLAKLLMNGVVSPSFIPSEQLEELRKLSRYRAKKVGVKNATKNRIIKLVESEGIKLATVLSDVLGKSGRAMLQALVDGGQSAEQMAELAQGSLRTKKAELVRALSNPVNETTLWILRQLLDDLTQEEARVAQVEAELSRRLQASYSREMVLLQTIPGIAQVIAATIVAETGADMSVFLPRLIWPRGQGWLPAITRAQARVARRLCDRAIPGFERRWCRRLTCSLASATRLCAPSFASAAQQRQLQQGHHRCGSQAGRDGLLRVARRRGALAGAHGDIWLPASAPETAAGHEIGDARLLGEPHQEGPRSNRVVTAP
ncbi:MAG: IS110 family transposase [Polyangiaceae bacterium]